MRNVRLVSPRWVHTLFLSLWMLLSSTACSHFGAYQPPLHQGKELSIQDVAALRPGMTQKAVIKQLGTPITNDPFNSHQWTYVYRLQNYDQVETHFLLIRFTPAHRIHTIEMDPALQQKLPSPTNATRQHTAAP